MSAACNRTHHPAMGIWPVGHPVCGLQASSYPDRLRAARCRVARLVDQWRQALVAGEPQLRSGVLVVHVADLCHGTALARIGDCSDRRKAQYAPGGCACAAAGQVMGGIGGRSPSDGGAMVANRRSCSRGSMVAPGESHLRALEAMPGRFTPIFAGESTARSLRGRSAFTAVIVSGSVVTPGQTATGGSK